MEHSLDDEYGTNDQEERYTGTTIEHTKISSLEASTVAIEFPIEWNVNSEQGNNVGATPPIDNDVNINGVNELMDTEALDMQT
ncbi:hypothetical protein DVH24_029118 [Malus domestica]|uniref:Uncharacterized protein n=1 Tax=Malus domestica TaxID=3750 RepID=A0A498HXU7_MALDO|nr:hypothetical protein DVH24_029118 [Malus domestica]